MVQGALKFQGLKDLGSGSLSNCQNFTCAQFVGALYEKLVCTSINELYKGSEKVISTDNSFRLHLLHSTCSPRPPHKLIMNKR